MKPRAGGVNQHNVSLGIKCIKPTSTGCRETDRCEERIKLVRGVGDHPMSVAYLNRQFLSDVDRAIEELTAYSGMLLMKSFF